MADKLEEIVGEASRLNPETAFDRAFTGGRAFERERCAKIADAVATAAQEQIDKNNEYKARTGSTDEAPNDLCRHRKFSAEHIAATIRRC